MAEGDHLKKKWNVIFVLGPPGCGKGTQCQKISEEFRYLHLSAGDLLRAERTRKDAPFFDIIDEHIRNGTIVPVEITCKLLENAMSNDNGESKGYLIDGFPRNKDNLDGWFRQMNDKTNLQRVLFLDCASELCVKRCLGRGHGRADDNEESLKQRLSHYEQVTKLIIDHFEQMKLVTRIDSSGTPEQVHAEIQKMFATLEV